jgi:hypothetical protein
MKTRYAVTAGTLTVFGVFAGVIPAQAAAPSNIETIVGIQTSVTGNTSPISGSGPVTGVGKDVQTGNLTDNFVFSAGTLKITHHSSEGGGKETFNKNTCLFQFSDKGTCTVTGGTKAYAGATGQGTYTLTGLGIGCNQKKPPLAVSVILHASGPLNVPK